MSSSGVLAVVFEAILLQILKDLMILMNLTWHGSMAWYIFFETVFCAKESFSVADVAVGSYLLYVRTLGSVVPDRRNTMNHITHSVHRSSFYESATVCHSLQLLSQAVHFAAALLRNITDYYSVLSQQLLPHDLQVPLFFPDISVAKWPHIQSRSCKNLAGHRQIKKGHRYWYTVSICM